jgi:hypothetical protein
VNQKETYRKTLEYALGIAGSEFALSVRMKVSLAVLRNWLAGISEIPTVAFLDAIDVIAAASPADIARSREALRKQPEIPKPESPEQ